MQINKINKNGKERIYGIKNTFFSFSLNLTSPFRTPYFLFSIFILYEDVERWARFFFLHFVGLSLINNPFCWIRSFSKLSFIFHLFSSFSHWTIIYFFFLFKFLKLFNFSERSKTFIHCSYLSKRHHLSRNISFFHNTMLISIRRDGEMSFSIEREGEMSISIEIEMGRCPSL